MSETPTPKILSEKNIKTILEYEGRTFRNRLKWILNDRVEFLARHGIERDEARVHTARTAILAAFDFVGGNTPLIAGNPGAERDS